MIQLALHLRDVKVRVYVSRKGEKGHISIEDFLDAWLRELEDYIKKSRRRLISTISYSTGSRKTERITMNRKKK